MHKFTYCEDAAVVFLTLLWLGLIGISFCGLIITKFNSKNYSLKWCDQNSLFIHTNQIFPFYSVSLGFNKVMWWSHYLELNRFIRIIEDVLFDIKTATRRCWLYQLNFLTTILVFLWNLSVSFLCKMLSFCCLYLFHCLTDFFGVHVIT